LRLATNSEGNAGGFQCRLSLNLELQFCQALQSRLREQRLCQFCSINGPRAIIAMGLHFTIRLLVVAIALMWILTPMLQHWMKAKSSVGINEVSLWEGD
jgi:hypothetical protein